MNEATEVKKEKHPGGRPTTYTLELAEEICHETSSSSKGLGPLCNENDNWPCYQTVYRWLEIHPEFSEMYARAKQRQVEVLVDEIITISDDTNNDFMVNENGTVVANHEHIQRSRLRVDSRKWLAAKLAPRIYGERVHTEHSGYISSPIAEIPQEKKDAAICEAADAIRGIIRRSDSEEGGEK